MTLSSASTRRAARARGRDPRRRPATNSTQVGVRPVSSAPGSPDETTTSWGATETSEEPAAAAWDSGATTDPWAAEPVAAGAASLVTGDEVGAADPDASFFSEGNRSATDVDDDPLAAMVREAVDRVTDGDGAN